jgi:hypothetical protein
MPPTPRLVSTHSTQNNPPHHLFTNTHSHKTSLDDQHYNPTTLYHAATYAVICVALSLFCALVVEAILISSLESFFGFVAGGVALEKRIIILRVSTVTIEDIRSTRPFDSHSECHYRHRKRL